MKKNVIKTAFAAVCVVAAGMGGLKAYNVANQSQADMLLAENIEALSSGDNDDEDGEVRYTNLPCKYTGFENDICTVTGRLTNGQLYSFTVPSSVNVNI